MARVWHHDARRCPSSAPASLGLPRQVQPAVAGSEPLCCNAQGALPGLVGLLKRYVPFTGPPNTGASVVRRAADAITNLAHENVVIKSKVRAEGGIPPLVCLLESYDAKVRAAALAPTLADD